MKSTRLLTLLLLPILVLAAGCSSENVYPVVSRDTAVSRDKALIVMGVSYCEMYNDTQENLEKKLFSSDLLKEKKNLRDKLVEKDGTALSEPLHYLSNFRFRFMSPGDVEHEFVRFNLDTREYEPIAIHEFEPGPVRLVGIATDQFRFKPNPFPRGDDEDWHKYWVYYEEPFGAWDLEQGKITYMGHLTLYFRTKRFVRGLLTPRELVESVKLVAIVMEDRFAETQKQLHEKKPWFPASEMVNQSRTGKWIYDEAAFEKFTAAPVTDMKKKEKRVIKRNIKKYFF